MLDKAKFLVTSGEDSSKAFGAFANIREGRVKNFASRRLRSRFGDAVAGPLLGRRGDQKGVEEKVRGSYEKQEASGRKRERKKERKEEREKGREREREKREAGRRGARRI